MGLMFDTIRIPMPIIRPVAIPQPGEMTMSMPLAPMATPTMMPVMPMPVMPIQGANAGLFGAQPSLGGLGGQMTIQGQLSMQQAAILMMAAQGQLSPQMQTMLLSLVASGQLTPQQITSLIESLTSQRTGTQSSTGGGGSAMLPGRLDANPVANATAPANVATPPGGSGSQRSGTAFATEANPTPAPSAAPTSAQTTASLQEQLRIAEQRLKTLEDNWHTTPK
jgi:hypothetical protein